MTPREQLRAIRGRVRQLERRMERTFADDVVPALDKERIVLAAWDELDDADRRHLGRIFDDRIFPVLTPLSVDPAHPFPYISSLSLNLGPSRGIPRRACGASRG
jgi:polyphosphate kinase